MLVWLQFSIKEKSLSISRLGRKLFGKKNENLKNLKERAKNQDNSSASETAGSGDSSGNTLKKTEESEATSSGMANGSGSSSENKPEEKPSTGTSDNSEVSPSQPVSAKIDSPKQPTPKKKKGHGRRPLDDYNFSKIIHIPHDKLKAGEKCPLCKKGTVYYIDPEVLLVIRGQPPLKAEAYSAEGLRCNLCQAIFRAIFPKEVISQPKADITARAIVCLAKYQLGTPLYRLETWQSLLGVPISDSEMWEWTESVALALFPVHQALINMASKGEVIYNDDTKTKVLELIKENELAKGDKKHRKGMFTSILLSKVEGRQIAVYLTGRKNSGENLDELLDRRPNGSKRPVQACDASTQNLAERHETDLAKCLNHARHNFCELVEVWPKETMKIIEMINTVFFNDRATKTMDEDERLKYHQEHSSTIMDDLKKYCTGLLDNKIVEPNSGFGKAIKYVNNHWEGLTLFLRNGKAPLSNNDAERAIKSFVLIRKNSYFYKTCWGAFVGDTLLSTIKTCALNGINPYDYLIAIQVKADEVSKNPCAWMPWNYMENNGALFVQTQPAEEMYQHNQTSTPIIPQPNLEGRKQTLREKARDFFRRIYPAKKHAFMYLNAHARG
jgi:transposase